MEFRVLGALRVMGDDGRSVYVGTAHKPRLMLAAMLSRAGQPVSVDWLISVLWADRPPPSARRNIHQYAQRLRATLTARRFTRTAGGYLLSLQEGDSIDASQFEGALRASAGGDDTPRDSAELLRQALELWSGPAYAEFDGCDALANEAARLEQLRLSALDRLARARLSLGQHDEVIGDLTEVCRAHPFREDLCAHLMLALHRAGRQADALAVFRRLRTELFEQLGVEPGTAIQHLHRQILRNDADLRTPAATAGPNFLPRDISDFVGRATSLRQLDDLAAGGTIVITAIAGAGKTALAVHWAHRVVAKYPDGQLYVNLRGFDPRGPITTLSALGTLLKALGSAPEQIPVDLDDAAALYRSATAGRRLLVVLDDARSAEHVRALLPTGTGSLAIVTSRDSLAGLVARDGARPVALPPMPAEDAGTLLESILGARRVADERGAAAELAVLCGNLPLALRIVAANLLTEPGRSIAATADNLRYGHRLAHLSVADDAGTAMQAVFEQSYAALSPADRRVFGLLGLHPGIDITAEATASLSSTATADAHASLRRLTQANLVTEFPEDRYQLHDLVKLFAAKTVESEMSESDRARASAALLDFYLHAAASAASVIAPQTPILTVAPSRHERHVDASAAMSWLQAEQHNLVAAVHHAAVHGPTQVAWRLADVLRGYFWIRRDIGDWIGTARAGMTAAVGDRDVLGQAAMHLSLGNASRAIGRIDESLVHYDEALSMSRSGGWVDGEVAALGGLGIAHSERGDKRKAIELFEAAARLNERTGRTAALAVSLSNIGALRLNLGELRQAADNLAGALDLFQATGNRVGEAVMHCNLALVQLDLGREAEAARLFKTAITIHAELADRSGETLATLGLAELSLRTDRLGDAARYAQLAIGNAEDIDSPRHRAVGLVILAHVHRRRAQLDEALTLAGQALTIAREISMRFIETDALDAMAQIKNDQGERHAAEEDALRALSIAQADGYASMIAKALTTLAEIQVAAGQTAQAGSNARQALDICERTGIQQCRHRSQSVLRQCADNP